MRAAVGSPSNQGAHVIGLRVHSYEIRSLLAEGGIGPVYLAVHPWLGRRAAVKVLAAAWAADRGLLARFLEEVKRATSIRHPNVVDLFDVGTLAGGQPYSMTEYLEGEPLSARLAKGPLAWPRARPIVEQAASAVAAAHALDIFHRDLRPENVFLCPSTLPTGGERVKILGFGMAQLRDEIASRGLDAARTPGRPPLYLAPEQAQGRPADERSDVYALGAILYHLICGAPPYLADDRAGLIERQAAGPPRSPREVTPAIPAAVEAVALRALAARPEDRFASMSALLEALAATPGGGAPSGGRDSAFAGGRRRCFLGRIAAGAMGLGVALVFLPLRPTSSQPRSTEAPAPASPPPDPPTVCPEIPPASACTCPVLEGRPAPERRRPKGRASRQRSPGGGPNDLRKW